MPYRTADHTMVPGYQNQVGAEIWTISTKCAEYSYLRPSPRKFTVVLSRADFMLSASFLVLIVGAPRQNDKTYQKAAIYISTLVIVLLFSGLIKDFKIKNGGKRFQ